MGLDSGFNCYKLNHEYDFRKHYDFNELVNDLWSDLNGPSHVDVPMVVTEELLDALEESLSEGGAEPASSVPDSFYDRSPRDWDAAVPYYLAIVSDLRKRLENDDRVIYWCSA